MEEQKDEQLQHIKGAIEAILFVNERPVSFEQIKKALETIGAGDVKKAIAELNTEYEERKSGMHIVEIAEGYQMLSNPAYVTYVRNLFKTKHKEKLSKPALETIAIIAYKQPVTRADIEIIRGVNSDGVVNHLLNKELIKVIGRKDVAGKPFMYGTNKQFMEYFGLKSMDVLPKLENFTQIEAPAEEGLTVIEDEAKVVEAKLDEEHQDQADPSAEGSEESQEAPAQPEEEKPEVTEEETPEETEEEAPVVEVEETAEPIKNEVQEEVQTQTAIVEETEETEKQN